MLTSPFRVLRFDAFTLDLARSTLRRGDKALPLRRQSFDVLRCLAEHAGKVVSRDELIEAVWTAPPARPEDSVVQCIKDIPWPSAMTPAGSSRPCRGAATSSWRTK